MNISSNIYKKSGEIFNNIAKKKWMQDKLNQGVSDPARFAAAMLVTSIVSKDAIGCVLYTTQSLNNKKIPEEKRKFVAALDLMNGIIMVGGQFLIGKIIDAKLTPKLTSKYTGIIKDKFTGKETTVNPKAIFHPDNIEKHLRNIAKEKSISLENVDVDALVKKINKTGRTPFEKGFGILVAAIATTALTKRTLAPLLSTPLAGWFKEKFMDKKKKPETTDTLEIASKTVAPSWPYAANNNQNRPVLNNVASR